MSVNSWPAAASPWPGKPPQFAQGVGAQRREHHKPVHRQRAVPRRNERLRISLTCAAPCWPTPCRGTAPGSGRRVLRRGSAPDGAMPKAPGRAQPRPAPAPAACGSRCSSLPAGSARQQRVRLQPAAHRVPVRPSGRLQAYPLQPLFHAPRHFLVQPGRLCGRGTRPAQRRRRDRWKEVGRRQGRLLKGQAASILRRCCARCLRTWEALPDGPACPAGQCAICRRWPARSLCEACVTRFAQPVLRCATCALPVPAGVVRSAVPACVSRHRWTPASPPWPGLPVVRPALAFKFAGRAGLGGHLGDIAAQRALGRASPGGGRPRVMPMPLSPSACASAASTSRWSCAPPGARQDRCEHCCCAYATPRPSLLDREERCATCAAHFAGRAVARGTREGSRTCCW
jgi:hypothetical protein